MDFSEDKLISNFKFFNNSGVIVDVGAHQGLFSLIFAKKGWDVIAFEAEKNNYQILKQKAMEFSNFICIEKAVYDYSGLKIPFYTSKKHYGIHSIKPFHKTHQKSYSVQTTRLDDALNELNITSVDLLKIDIEGADLLALKSFDFNKFNPKIIMIEFMDSRSLPNFGYTHHDIVDYMKEWDYSAHVSEWEPIQEYGVEGEKSSHKWIQCVPYSLDNDPAWGNLIFVLSDNEKDFNISLKTYLNKINRDKKINVLKKVIKKLLPKKLLINIE